MAEFYIIDVRQKFASNPYLTVWRPKNAGYAYPLSWAGRYSKTDIDQRPGYYHKIRYGTKRTLDRFPVPCAAAIAAGSDPFFADLAVAEYLPICDRIDQALAKHSAPEQSTP